MRLAGLRKQLQGNWVHGLFCLPCSEPSFLLPLTYTHGYECSCQACFSVSMQDTHSLACKRLLLHDSQSPPFLKTLRYLTESFTMRMMLLCFLFPGGYKVARPVAGLGTSTLLYRCVQGQLADRGPAVPSTFPGCQHGGVAFRATQSQHVLSLLLPTLETAAASFFNPAQVRPDFPVQITIAIFTFHTPKGKTPWLCWSRCLRRRLKD